MKVYRRTTLLNGFFHVLNWIFLENLQVLEGAIGWKGFGETHGC